MKRSKTTVRPPSSMNFGIMLGYEVSNDESQRETRKLIDFFRSPEGDTLGRNGDLDNLSPAECAIRAMKELQKIRKRFR